VEQDSNEDIRGKSEELKRNRIEKKQKENISLARELRLII
jgi:hypothetical protein